MTTKVQRIAFTPSAELRELLEELSDVMGIPVSSIVAMTMHQQYDHLHKLLRAIKANQGELNL